MANLLVERSSGAKLNPDGDSFGQYPFPVKGGQKILAGAAVAILAGYLIALTTTATAGAIPCGRALETFDNTNGADGAGTVKVEQGVLSWDVSSGDPPAQADVGNAVYFEDNHTIAKTSSSGSLQFAGKLLGLYTQASTGATYALVEQNWRAAQTESAIGLTSLSIAGAAGTQTVTSASLAGIVELTGVLTGNRILNITDLAAGKQWTFANKTTGSFTINIEIAGANPIALAQGSRAIFYSDGTQLRRVTADNP